MADTRPNEDHDPSGTPSGPFPGAGSNPASARNRPAVGAREVSSPQSADGGWQAGAGATDFLGLEPDLRGGAPQSGAGGPTESWLFDIEQAETGFAPDGGVATATQTQTHTAGEDVGGDADELLADEGQPADGEPSEDEAPASEPARRGGRRVLVALAILAVAGTGGWYGWQKYGPKPAPAAEVATATPKPTAKPVAKPGATKPAPAKPAPTPEVPASTAAANPTDAPIAQPVETPLDPSAASEPVASVEIQPVPPADVPVASAETAPLDPADGLLERSPIPAAKAPALPGGAPGPGGGRHANERDWAGMWTEPTIPTDAIRGPTRLRTLHVGLVRAELVNGEYIEGTLHAVGESRIWLDVQLGRMSFDASDVRELVQIVGQQGQPVPLGTQALAGLPRVEVLLPGGTLVGRVLNRAGDKVTFVTDEGMRLSVEAIDVRPAPNGRSRLIGPVADRKP